MKKEVLVETLENSDYQFFVVVGDIGATHSYFGIFGIKGKKEYDLIIRHSYETSEYADVYIPINDILSEANGLFGICVNRCCIGAAGPVSRKRSYIKLTNCDKMISVKGLLDNTLLNKVILVNDFEAIGYGLDLLDMEKDTHRLHHVGEDLTGGWTYGNTYAVLGAGAGLGMSIAYYDYSKHLHVPLASEGGHMDFSPRDPFELGLMEYLRKKVMDKKDSYPDFERVLSGSGLINTFDFLYGTDRFEKTDLAKQIYVKSGKDKLMAIDKNYGVDPISTRTMDMFINFYARVARNLALCSESYSGLFLTGTIALKNQERFKDGKFMEEFEMHDKRNDVLRKVPVYLITNKDTAMFGCCNVAVNFFNIW